LPSCRKNNSGFDLSKTRCRMTYLTAVYNFTYIRVYRVAFCVWYCVDFCFVFFYFIIAQTRSSCDTGERVSLWP